MDSKDQSGFGIKSFEAILNEAAEQQPARVAFTLLENDHHDNELITYRQLKNQVDFVASVLYSRFNVGDRVVLLYPTSIEFTVAFLGCLAAGVVAVPIHTPRGLTPTNRDKWVARIIDESKAKGILTTDVLFQPMKDRFPEIDTIDPGNVPPESMPAGFSPAATTEAMLIYSMNQSGEAFSTRYSYSELLGKMQTLKGRFEHSGDSVIVSCIATSGEMGVLGHVLQPIFCKCTSVFMSPGMAYRKPSRWLLAISDYSATTACAPQEVIELCNQLEPIDDPLPQLGTLNACYTESGVVGTEIATTFTQKFSQYGLALNVIKPFELRAPKGNVNMNFATPDDLNSRLFADV